MIVAQVVQGILYVPMLVAATHSIVCETRAVLFLVNGFNVLSDRIANIAVDNDEDIREIAALHVEILDTALQFKKIYEPYNLVIFSQYFLMALLGTVATIQQVYSMEVTLLAPIVWAVIGLTCVLGDTLESASEDMIHKAYSCRWYEAEMGFRKMLLNIMTRSSRPAVVKASLLGNIRRPLTLSLLKMWYRFLQFLLNFD